MKLHTKCSVLILFVVTMLYAQTESNPSSEDSESNTAQVSSPEKILQNNLLMNDKKSIDTAHNFEVDPTLINDMPSTLEIVTIPDSVFVILNDSLQGKSPLILNEISPGKHTIVLKKLGYFAKKVTINVPPGVTNKLEFTMEEPAMLSITSEPDSTIVYLNKENVGTTPYISNQLKKGNYNVILLKEGFQKIEQNLLLEAGKSDSLHIVLKEKITVPSDSVSVKDELQKQENSKLRSILDKIALGIFAGFSLVILLIELSQDN